MTKIADNPVFAAKWEELQVKLQSVLSAAHANAGGDMLYAIEQTEQVLSGLRQVAQAEVDRCWGEIEKRYAMLNGNR